MWKLQSSNITFGGQSERIAPVESLPLEVNGGKKISSDLIHSACIQQPKLYRECCL
jgi:hypothetical protein